MKKRNSVNLFLLLFSILLIVLMLFVFMYIMGTIAANDRASAEFGASQAVATATEKYLIQGTLAQEDVPSGLLGFGIYDLTNQANFRFGAAPDRLPSNMREGGGLMRYSNDGIIQLVRPLCGSGKARLM
jgi:hypothetical protein